MKKYKLINTTTKEEHLCDKVTIDGFDYYVSDEKYAVGENCIGEDEGGLRIHKCVILNNCLAIGCKKVIATNNPNIDIPKVVNEVEKIADEWFLINGYNQFDYIHSHRIPDAITTNKLFKTGYNKSQETHPFSEDDMVEFGKYAHNDAFSLSNVKTFKELFQLWKEQQTKIIYYE